MKDGPQKGIWTHTIINIDSEAEPEPAFIYNPHEWQDVCNIMFT